jgi:hypothetical protein
MALGGVRGQRVRHGIRAWSVSTSATIAALTILGGLLASVTSLRTAMAVSGLLILATPLLLPRRERKQHPQHAWTCTRPSRATSFASLAPERD